MPDRTDKKDATTLAAALTGLRIEHVAGVSGDTIPDKALPFHQEARPYSNAQYGVWRSNMNILNDMVKNNVQSALILEDDADWDVRIKAQLVDFARNSRRLLNLTEADQQFSPYGDAWKIVWLGHCASEISNDRIIASHDPTVAVVSKMETTLPEMLKTDFPAHTRLVHIANAPICTYAYGTYTPPPTCPFLSLFLFAIPYPPQQSHRSDEALTPAQG
jgi:GR25 family glycosyltransferase involved in LPS biosynthesis